jgi:hypothetical protein
MPQLTQRVAARIPQNPVQFWLDRLDKDTRPAGSRYRYNLHEMRDEATTLLHTYAKNQGFDMDCTRLWCGQIGEIDSEIRQISQLVKNYFPPFP